MQKLNGVGFIECGRASPYSGELSTIMRLFNFTTALQGTEWQLDWSRKRLGERNTDAISNI